MQLANQVLMRPDIAVGADLPAWIACGGGAALAQALRAPETVIATIAEAGLRGLGGAGFPTHRKWTPVAAASQGRTRRVSSTKAVGLARLTMGGLSYARAKGAAMRRVRLERTRAQAAHARAPRGFKRAISIRSQSLKDGARSGWSPRGARRFIVTRPHLFTIE